MDPSANISQGMNYIIDVYALNANSAIAANTFFRSCLAGGFAMFATAMVSNGPQACCTGDSS